jgi:hypothetical protein
MLAYNIYLTIFSILEVKLMTMHIRIGNVIISAASDLYPRASSPTTNTQTHMTHEGLCILHLFVAASRTLPSTECFPTGHQLPANEVLAYLFVKWVLVPVRN